MLQVGDSDEDGLCTKLTSDGRILWYERDEVFAVQSRSSHGSSVAAIFSRLSLFGPNDSIWQQIKFTPQDQSASGSGSTPPGLTVGIVDTGVSPIQPSILNNVIASQSFVSGSPSVDDWPQSVDSNFNGVYDEATGHGTMVAGIILQMAPNAQLVIAKSADSDGNGSAWTVLKGIEYCVENGAKVINVSLGSSNPLAGFAGFIDWVENKGSLIISPVGNSQSNTALYPAAYSRVICVTGLMPDNTIAPFSSWSYRARSAVPATGIQSLWWDGTNATASGTSLSAAIVTGALAAIPATANTSPAQLRRAIKSSGRNIDSLNPGYEYQLGSLLNWESLNRRLSDTDD